MTSVVEQDSRARGRILRLPDVMARYTASSPDRAGEPTTATGREGRGLQLDGVQFLRANSQ
jgi:hypothetical protein